jgi:hypothetical protein
LMTRLPSRHADAGWQAKPVNPSDSTAPEQMGMLERRRELITVLIQPVDLPGASPFEVDVAFTFLHGIHRPLICPTADTRVDALASAGGRPLDATNSRRSSAGDGTSMALGAGIWHWFSRVAPDLSPFRTSGACGQHRDAFISGSVKPRRRVCLPSWLPPTRCWMTGSAQVGSLNVLPAEVSSPSGQACHEGNALIVTSMPILAY